MVTTNNLRANFLLFGVLGPPSRTNRESDAAYLATKSLCREAASGQDRPTIVALDKLQLVSIGYDLQVRECCPVPSGMVFRETKMEMDYPAESCYRSHG